jgi:hypothetical protein
MMSHYNTFSNTQILKEYNMSAILTNPTIVLGLAGIFFAAFLYLTSTVDRSPSRRVGLVAFMPIFTALVGELLLWDGVVTGSACTIILVVGVAWVWFFQNQVDPTEAVQMAEASAAAAESSATTSGTRAGEAAASAAAAEGSAAAAADSAREAAAAVGDVQTAVSRMNHVFALLNANCSTLEAHVADVVELLVVGDSIAGWDTRRAPTVAIDSATGKYTGGVVNNQEAGLLLAAAAIATNAGHTLPANYTIQDLLDALRS